MTKHPHYRGVYIRTAPRPSPYFARVSRNGQWIFSGYFRTPEGAAGAYDQIAASIWGERATLNFPTCSQNVSGKGKDFPKKGKEFPPGSMVTSHERGTP